MNLIIVFSDTFYRPSCPYQTMARNGRIRQYRSYCRDMNVVRRMLEGKKTENMRKRRFLAPIGYFMKRRLTLFILLVTKNISIT